MRRASGDSSGFTLLELVVVMAIVIGLAGLVVPLVSNEIQDSKIARALDDTARIAGALLKASRDAGEFPGCDDASMPPAALLTNGKRPAGLPLGHLRRLSEYLGLDSPFCQTKKTWKGPYLGEVGQDPWKRAYVVIVPAPKPDVHVWSLSAGPDGVLQTSERSAALEGDDVGVCVR